MTKKSGAGLGLLTDDSVIVEDVPKAFDSLKPKYQIFVKELFSNGWNKTQAALAAGSKNEDAAIASANIWLKREDIKQAVEEYRLIKDKADDLTVEDLKAELWRNHLKAARVSDSNKALELLLRCMGAFKDSVEIEGNMGFASVIADLRQTAKEISADENSAKVIEAEVLPDNGESSPDKGSSIKLLDKGDTK